MGRVRFDRGRMPCQGNAVQPAPIQLGIGQNETDLGSSPVVCNLETELRSNVNPERQQTLVEITENKPKKLLLAIQIFHQRYNEKWTMQRCQ